MGSAAALTELERTIQHLSHDERLWLLERLIQGLRRGAKAGDVDALVAQMAADPEMRRELAAIAAEFAPAERLVRRADPG
jgi:hypothetical protein